MLDKLLQWDQKTFIYLNNLGVKTYDTFWITITGIYTWIPLFIIFFILLSLHTPKKKLFFKVATMVLLILFILLASYLCKELVARPRPNNNEDINTLFRILKNPIDYSFFSGHSSSSFSITTLIILFLRKKIKWVWLFYTWPFLFAYSRIYVGVHYPLDLIIGGIIGILSGILFYKGYRKFIKRDS